MTSFVKTTKKNKDLRQQKLPNIINGMQRSLSVCKQICQKCYWLIRINILDENQIYIYCVFPFRSIVFNTYCFQGILVLHIQLGRTLLQDLAISNTVGILYMNQELLLLPEHHVAHLQVSVLCCVFCFVLCLVLPMSLGCLSMIITSVFTNFYLSTCASYF